MKAKGKLGCACKLEKKHDLSANHATVASSDFVIPEIAVNGVILATGLLTGVLGWNYQEKPIGRILLGAGGGLTAVGIAFLIREAFLKRTAA